MNTPTPNPNNRMALTSLIAGIVSWVFWALFFCFNLTIGFVISLATFGLAGICFAIIGFLPAVGWLAAVITGHVGIAQIGRTGEGGRGLAIAGLILGYVGIALTLCTLVLYLLGALGVIVLPSLQGLTTPAP